MAIIDRSGDIRATSGNQGNPTLENESSLRSLIQTLLHEKKGALEAGEKALGWEAMVNLGRLR